MRFTQTDLAGAWLIEPEPARDARGYFMRTFCVEEFGAHGLETHFVQHSASFTAAKGALRGMHFQNAPHAEVKVVTCLRGAVLDVVIDLRPDSPTFRQWRGFELSEENQRRLYIPKGFAHGFQALTGSAELFYLISEAYAPQAASGVRWNDPAFAIQWPAPPSMMSEKDSAWPDFVG